MRLPVALTLRPSRSLAAALVLAHALAAAQLVGLSAPVAMPLAALILLSLIFSLKRHVHQPPVTALTLRADGTLEVDGRGSRGIAEIDSRTTVLPWLMVLLLRSGNRRIALVLPPDALGGEGHRQLRLWLRWKASAATA